VTTVFEGRLRLDGRDNKEASRERPAVSGLFATSALERTSAADIANPKAPICGEN
jgi:hypothetical protein